MAFVIGHPLSEPYYSAIRNPSVGVTYQRACTICSYRYVTVEVPLVPNWTGSRADCCPIHLFPGLLRTQLGVQRAMSGKYESSALMKVISFGGVYRRRECTFCLACGHTRAWHKHPRLKLAEFGKGFIPCRKRQPDGAGGEKVSCGCDAFDPCLGPKGKPTRWTTGEFSSDAVVVTDVEKCPQCGGQAPIERRSRAQLQARALSAQWQKRKLEKKARG